MSRHIGNQALKVGMLTKEWPPHIYGGAGVHVKNLVEALSKNSGIEPEVHCFGEARPDATGYVLGPGLTELNPAQASLLIDVDMASNLSQCLIAHSHTWYANFAGYLASKMFGIPHVITAHSLEPLRPWKAEQLGGGYVISSWTERFCYQHADAIVAVSDGMRSDVLTSYPEIEAKKVHTIRNGIDTAVFQPTFDPNVLAKYEITEPYAIFVGRITRQKGLAHLLRAWRNIPTEYALVVAAGSPDEPAIGAEVEDLISELQVSRPNVVWIKEMLSRHELLPLLSHARTFVCPSIYEPLGIVNLEAMACETAVVASRVGGIPEVVDEGRTGLLVDYNGHAQRFEASFTEALLQVLGDESLSIEMGQAGRARAIAEFGWDKVAAQTIELYRRLLN